jgi:hypothetical protein
MKTRLCGLVVGLWLVSCGAPGRPSGQPPPEYEVPHVEPWPPASAAPPKAAPPASPPAAQGVEPAPEAAAGLPQNTGGSGAKLPAGTP